MSTVDWHALIAQLSEPLPADQIKWRAGATNRDKTKAISLAYAEARAYEDRLNTVCPGAWHVDVQPWGENRIICRLTIHNITRASTGEAGDSNPEIGGTSAEAQALKRACSKYGLGRYLYDLPTTWVAYDPKTKKLLDVPRLTAPSPSREAATASPVERPPTSALGKERASAMHRELARIGVPRSSHYAFASQATGRFISSFSSLDESEAARIWKAAQQRTATIDPHSQPYQKPATFSKGPMNTAS